MKKVYYISTILLCVFLQTANAQMGVNSTGAAPNAAAMLDVRSSDKGFLMPRMTTTQRNAMPAITDGLMIYNTTTAEIEVYRGFLGWQTASRMGVPFNVSDSDASNGIIQGTNTGTGDAIKGVAVLGIGVRAYGVTGVYADGTTTGVFGSTAGGTGVFGRSNTNRGVWGRGLTTGDGVYGDALTGKGVYGLTSSSGTGVYGDAVVGTGNAVQGEANSGYGGYFRSVSGTGLAAISSSSYGIYAENTSATIPVAQFANLSGGIGLELIASTALKVTGAIKVTGGITAQPAFKIVSSAGNTAGHVLTIPNTTLANNTNDILIVTHNYSPTGIYLTKPYGVYWTGTNWTIFIEDFTAMAVGTAFNVLVIKQ